MLRKRLVSLAFVLLALGAGQVDACPVCFGAADGPMIDATRVGVLIMAAVTCAVLAAFAAFFLNLARRGSS